jgi:hypothetical protein
VSRWFLPAPERSMAMASRSGDARSEERANGDL